MASELLLVILIVLSSCNWMLVGGQACSLSAVQFAFSTVTVSAANVRGFSTPAARVTWSTTIPPQCVASVRVDFRTSSMGPVVATYTTNSTSETEFIQTGFRCAIYYIRVVVTSLTHIRATLSSRQVQVAVGDIQNAVGVSAAVTSDNTSVRLSWGWESHQGLSMCIVDLVQVHYQPKGGSLMMYTVGSTTAATSATVPNLHCNTEYTIWVYGSGVHGHINGRSAPIRVSLPARAPPTPTDITAQIISTSSVRITWQWSSSGPAPDCFNTTTVTYHPEGGVESFLQLSDPAATESTLNIYQCNTNYTITVVATAGEHRRERTTFFTPPGPHSLSAAVLSSTSVHLTWVAPCHTQQYHIYYRGTCGTYINKSRLETDRQDHTFGQLQEGVNYSFTINQTGFSGGRVFSTGPVYAKTFTAVPSEAPQLMEAMFAQHTEVLLRWRRVPCIQQNGLITGYVVRYYATCGADRDVQRNNLVVTTGSTIIDGLTPNTEYAFQVAAININGTGPLSEPITLGGAPQLVAVTPANSTTVTVSWSEVQCFNGSGAVTHYLVQYHSMCSGAVQNVTISGTVHEATVSRLTPNASLYTFQVAAVHNQNTGPFSNLVDLATSVGTPPMCSTDDSGGAPSICPTDNSAIDQTMVPSDETVSSDETTVPFNETTIPSDETTVPSNENAAPFNETTVPSNENAAPFNETTVPSNENAAPANETTVPAICQEVWAVTGVTAVLVITVFILTVVVVVQFTVIWSRRSTSQTTNQAKKIDITEIPMKECSAYGEVSCDGGHDCDQREVPHVYEIPHAP